MSDTVKIIISFVLSFVIAFAMTPLVKRLAFKIGAIDVPKDKRRMHKKPIPRLGGLAIFIGFFVSTLTVGFLPHTQIGRLLGQLHPNARSA
mgnify:CR=1 FL=1